MAHPLTPKNFLLFSTLSVSIALTTACSKNESTGAETGETVTIESVETVSNDMSAKQAVSGVQLQFMDTSVDPTEDFFAYANGAWLKDTEIPADKSRWGAFDMLRDKARKDVKAIVENAVSLPEAKQKGTEAQQIADYYASFLDAEGHINQQGLTPIQPFISKIDAAKTHKDLAALFGDLGRVGIDSPLGFYISTDEKDPNTYITYFGQSGLGLPDRDYYLKDDEKSVDYQVKYRQHIAAMFKLADFPEPQQAADAIYAIELALANGHWPRTELRDREKTYNKYSVDKLNDLSGAFVWNDYLAASGLNKADAVIISAPSYFESFNDLLQQFTVAQWQTYLRWHTLSRFAGMLPTPIEQEDFAFYGKVLSGVEEQQPRWERAVNRINAQLGDAIGKLYVEAHFSSAAKERMVQLVENLREAYRLAILDLDWMGEETKQKAIEKLSKFRPKIGYPDKWKDLSAIEIKADDLVGNYVRAAEFQHNLEVSKLGQAIDRGEWFMNPQTVNAYYNPGMNEIVFPAAILQPPFFNMAADDAINYGAIGAVIGHEMGHGFDDQGAKSNGDGLLENWWTETDLKEFTQRTGKLVAQYNGFEVLEGLHVNGDLTQGENIGDLGGLTIAYKAYQLALDGNEAPVLDNFTGSQRFFLGWAQVWANKYRDAELRRRILTDPHSPPRFRTNGVVRNMPEFYNAFGAEPGDALYLAKEERVKIW